MSERADVYVFKVPEDFQFVGKLAKFMYYGVFSYGVISLVLLALNVVSPPPFDTTDSPRGVRSGFRLMTDFGTGCEYLVTAQGHLTPRMASNGKQAGCQP